MNASGNFKSCDHRSRPILRAAVSKKTNVTHLADQIELITGAITSTNQNQFFIDREIAIGVLSAIHIDGVARYRGIDCALNI